MLYERSLTIERRLDELLHLIRAGRHSTPELARKLGVSEPTVSRGIAALRQRGYSIRSVKQSKHWAYELLSEPTTASPG
jgi:biotin operon repressor